MPSHESPGNCKLWGEEESVFFKSVATDKLHVLVGGHISKNIWAAQIDLDGEKRMQCWWEEKGSGSRKSWEREGIHDQNSLYEILKKTNKIFLRL